MNGDSYRLKQAAASVAPPTPDLNRTPAASPQSQRAAGSMASSATLQTPHSPQILQLPTCLLAYFYSAALVEFYSALDSLLLRP